jgi:outer membrane protein OmpA-like peptidoglycan-associated protein
MTIKLQRVLWLWAGTLALCLLAILPFATSARTVAALFVVCGVSLGWMRSNRRAAHRRKATKLAADKPFPPASFRHPVVLVCGDDLDGLFGPVACDRLALRPTDQGCYVRVPDLEQLPKVSESILAVRPGWGGQLSVMLIVNPCSHTDNGVLAGRLRTLGHQLGLARRHGTALPLMLVSYVHSLQDEAPWFCWANGQPGPRVREAGACVSVEQWQLQPADSVLQAARMRTCIQLSSAAGWLHEAVMPCLNAGDASAPSGLATICAIKQVPAMPQVLDENLWRQWLRSKVALKDDEQGVAHALLPFPDPLLSLMPLRAQRTPQQRASVIALWLFALAGVLALGSSAWQNRLLLRQVSDELHRYRSIPELDQRERALREDAINRLRQTSQRLEAYYRHGEPLALGLGLYSGEHLRAPLWAVLANHREPSILPPLQASEPMRLDSLSLFSPGSAQLQPDSTKVLINALVGIKAQPGWLIVIAGHTDGTGDGAQNLRLSHARAAAVHHWMQHTGGIPNSCFAVQGFGASQPIASNDTEAGRAANRRVDIRLVPVAGACMAPPAGTDRQPPVAYSDL